MNNDRSLLSGLIRFCLENKLVVLLLCLFIILCGIYVAPFDWKMISIERSPVPVDAIPNIGENQQIVFTKWPGRSPQDVEDQITYPLTVSLLGIPGVKSIRSNSMFGFSSIYIIFKEKVGFYWSRSRILEKLNSLAPGVLPEAVRPSLGPDATALGQVFWYTLEGRDKNGNATGGWDLEELRAIQDWKVKYYLMAAEGVSEVASIGGFVKEYQIDIDPDAMRAYGINLNQIFKAVKNSNIDVGAKTIEINRVEYVIRGLGFIKKIADIEDTVIKSKNNVPVYIKDIANVTQGPALRRGALDKEGAQTVGGVVVVRHGENPLQVIKNVKNKIKKISSSLPSKTLSDGTLSQVQIVPFYDRTQLIHETLGTLKTALEEEILITIIVVIIMLFNLRSSIIISSMLPLAVLMCFIAMKLTGVAANIVALSGIAIAIGTIVDMGIIISENILKNLEAASPGDKKIDIIHKAAYEVGGAVLTAILTTIVGFLPVFAMTGSEGKLFKPLAWTKTFALISSVIIAITVLPSIIQVFFSRIKSFFCILFFHTLLITFGVFLFFKVAWWCGAIAISISLFKIIENKINPFAKKTVLGCTYISIGLLIATYLSKSWMPLGPEKGLPLNTIFVAGMITILLSSLILFQYIYGYILSFFLKLKTLMIFLMVISVLLGGIIWFGFEKTCSFIPNSLTYIGFKEKQIKDAPLWNKCKELFPGLKKEFMPPLDEGSFLLMPTTMPHASIGECLDVLQKQDAAIKSLPEVKNVVGKIGRVESPLDPAPISMIETVITYKSEFISNENGERINFKYDKINQKYVRDKNNKLLPDPDGRPFRQWRDKIKSPDDIWNEIVNASKILGTTSAPKLQPIKARLVMLQSGMRAPMGVKVKGPDLKTIEKVGIQIEKFLKEVPSVKSQAVIADRIIGKPYIEIDIDRQKIARYGISIKQVQNVIEIAIGGRKITTTVEGRERYPVRVRYFRELRNNLKELKKILIPSSDGTCIPIEQLATIKYTKGPQMIKSEDTFLVGYVVFDKQKTKSEVEVVQECQKYLKQKEQTFKNAYHKLLKDNKNPTQKEIDNLPGLNLNGCSYEFAGNYKNQIRAQKRLSIVLPLALFVIFIILYFQFRSVLTTLIVFLGITVAWAGGFYMIWLYGQDWFLDFSIFNTSMRELFQIHQINLSIAVWVGFLALFGIATDNGVVIASYIKQQFRESKPKNTKEIRKAILKASMRRIRPCMMTTATTILALIPVLTSVGKGAGVMVPMAIPSFGGMLLAIITTFIVPVLYCMVEEIKVKAC